MNYNNRSSGIGGSLMERTQRAPLSLPVKATRASRALFPSPELKCQTRHLQCSRQTQSAGTEKTRPPTQRFFRGSSYQIHAVSS